ncbi:tetratricopeptide repeat protein [Granulicella arctica]|uniref:Putative Zn-dependent protease n=1 Tax=Granulicella arctica TaxID=940613 RepID=A0A7Y9TIA7_9BACT|nr:tetratricopeptide repeat protein [Granulicella arctica]NYF80785.1 putative Zn-dependent protease [Granulicella arctica]
MFVSLTSFAAGQSVTAGHAASNGRAAELASRAQQSMAVGRFDAAEAAYLELTKLEPGLAEVYANLGAVYFQEGKFEDAIDALRHALRLKQSLGKVKTLLAICLAESGHSVEAIPGLEAGFRSSAEPQGNQIRRQCGLELLRTYTALHRDADAVETSLALNNAYPDDPEILYQTGRVYGNFTYLTMAKLRDKAPNSVWMLQAKAEARESEKKYDSALTSFENVLRLEPQRPGVHYRMGRVYLARFEQLHESKDRDQAADQFRAELAIDPGNGNAAYELAQIDYDLGNIDQARQQFESLIERRPEFEQARVGLAGILIQTQKPGEAALQLKRAIELEPNDEVAWYRLARALRQTGDQQGQKKALAEFQRLHALESSHLARAGILLEAGEVTPQQLGESTQP